MKKLLVFAVFAALTLAGCGERVEVPPAHVGKKSTPSGLQEGIIPPSKIRLSACWWPGAICETLILSEASDYPVKESMKIFMPKDKLNLSVDVRGTFSVSSQSANVDEVFARLTAKQINDHSSLISMTQIYDTYGAPVVREAVRTVLTRYSIMEIMENREAISAELAQEVRKRLDPTPITTIRFGLADIQPPEVIVTAQEEATKREIEIQKAEADKQVKLKEAEAALEVAIKQQEVDIKEAETQVLVNKKLAEGVTPAWVTQRALKALEKLPNGNHVILVPTEAYSNPAMMVGIMNKAMNHQQQR
jgi:regulator of protease activity HflC (stomatin/prohibitin superfamily)